jgi:hypothetical protein
MSARAKASLPPFPPSLSKTPAQHIPPPAPPTPAPHCPQQVRKVAEENGVDVSQSIAELETRAQQVRHAAAFKAEGGWRSAGRISGPAPRRRRPDRESAHRRADGARACASEERPAAKPTSARLTPRETHNIHEQNNNNHNHHNDKKTQKHSSARRPTRA